MKQAGSIEHAHLPLRTAGILALGVLLAATSSCSHSGGSSNQSGGGGNPGTMPLTVDFALRKDLHLGTVPALVADVHHADLDGDGFEDLVEADFSTQRVVVAFGNFDGSFTPAFELPTAGQTWMVTTGDFDGDSLLDIAAASQNHLGNGQSAVEVFLQGPAGQFGPAITFLPAVNPTALVAAPLSGIPGGAGPDELLVALRDAQTIARLSLDASNDLTQFASLDSSNLGNAGGPFTVAVVDLGADGLLDVVAGEEYVLGGGPGRIVQYARSAGTDFQDAVEVMSGLTTPIVENVGDVDSNGFDDVSVAQLGANEGFLLAADATGLSSVVVIDFGGETTSLIFPDLNGDGLAEAVATLFFQNSVQVRTAVSPLVWDAPVHYNVGLGPRAVAVVELPGDNLPDLLCSNGQDVSTMLNLGPDPNSPVGEPVFRCSRGYSTGIPTDGPTVVQAADLDNDGDMDAVAVTNRQQSVTFMEGAGDGTFSIGSIVPLMPTPDDEQGYLAIADMDLDGDLDVLTSVLELDEVILYRNQGSIAAFTDPPANDITPVGDRPLGIAVGDFDGDLMPDVVVANSGDNTLQVLINVGGGELMPQAPIALGFEPVGPVAMDLDNDDDLDLVLASADNGTGQRTVAILEGDGQGGFSVVEIHPLDGGTNNVALGDYDEDGLIDVVVGQSESAGDDLFLLWNQGGLSFTSQRFQVSPGPGTVVAADIDNDSNLDIVVATTPGELKLVLGDGNGNFEIEPVLRGELTVPRSTIAAALVDVNGDDLPDLLMGGRRAPFLWVGLNTSVPAP